VFQDFAESAAAAATQEEGKPFTGLMSQPHSKNIISFLKRPN
jgi:hypothetical protein